MEKDQYDSKLVRCPKLGQQITFSYCRRESGNLPCSRALRCWEQAFPASDYFRGCLTDEQWKMCFEEAPKPKIVSLIELIEQAKKNAQSKEK